MTTYMGQVLLPQQANKDVGLKIPKPLKSWQQGVSEMEAMPSYQAKSPKEKRAILDHVFNKFVSPSIYENIPPNSKIKTGDVKQMWIDSRLGGSKAGEQTLSEILDDLMMHNVASAAKAGVKTKRGFFDLAGGIIHYPDRKNLPLMERQLVAKYDWLAPGIHEELNKQEDIANTMLGSNYGHGAWTWTAEFPGRFFGGIWANPAYIATAELGGSVEGVAGQATGLAGVIDKSSRLARYSYAAARGAAEGYVAARAEGDKPKEALKGAAFMGVLNVAGEAIIGGGSAAIKYLSRMIGTVGPGKLKATLNAAAELTPEQIANADPTKESTAPLKASAQVLNEAAQKLGYKGWWDAVQQKKTGEVLKVVHDMIHQANEEAPIHNPDVVAAQGTKDINELKNNPLGAKLVEMLGQHGVTPEQAGKDIAEHVAEATEGTSGRPQPESTVGAATAESLEFSDNLSKRIHTNIQFEDRGHKFIAALAQMARDADKRPMTKEDEDIWRGIQHQLDQDPRWRDKTLQQRLAEGEQALHHIDVITKGGGKPDAAGKIRFWRSTVVAPGETQTSFQRQARAQTGDFPEAPFKVGDRVRVGSSNILGKVIEAYPNRVVVQTAKGEKLSVANDEVFSDKATKVRIAEQQAEKRESAQARQEATEAKEKELIQKQKQEAAKEKAETKEGEIKLGKTLEEIKKEQPQAYISKGHLKSLTTELLYNRNLRGPAFDAARKKAVADYLELVRAGATREQALQIVKDDKVAEGLEQVKAEAVERRAKEAAKAKEKVSTAEKQASEARGISEEAYDQARKELGRDAKAKDLIKRAREIDAAKEQPGPGAAHVTDPSFTGKTAGVAADYINTLGPMFTARKIQTFRDINARQTLIEEEKTAAQRLLAGYESSSVIKNIADGARLYVHNNSIIVDAAREVVGMPGKTGAFFEHQGQTVAIVSPTTLLDGRLWKGIPFGGTGTGADAFWRGHSVLPLDQAKAVAEDLMEAVREAKPVEGNKYRGMTFNMDSDRDVNLLVPFTKLKPGDVFDVPLSSFSYDKRIAGRFMDESMDNSVVLLEIEGPHKGMNLAPFNHFTEQEFLTNGSFQVTDIQRPEGTDWSGGGPRKMLHIKIKQVSTW